VVVIMAIVAAVVVPQFSSTTDDAMLSAAGANLATLRSVIQSYQLQHRSRPPTVDGSTQLLEVLLTNTRVDGSIAADGEFGPYLTEFPENPLTGVNTVKSTTKTTIDLADVTANNSGGWLYNETTGHIWLDSDPGFDM
jgi:type II secretory pathway pseudopilin PulG